MAEVRARATETDRTILSLASRRRFNSSYMEGRMLASWQPRDDVRACKGVDLWGRRNEKGYWHRCNNESV